MFSAVVVAGGRCGCKCSVDMFASSAEVAPLLGWDIIDGLCLSIQGFATNVSAAMSSSDEPAC